MVRGKGTHLKQALWRELKTDTSTSLFLGNAKLGLKQILYFFIKNAVKFNIIG